MLGAPGAPQQRAYIGRVIGTIRRGRLDHVIVLNEGVMVSASATIPEYYHLRTNSSVAAQGQAGEPVRAAAGAGACGSGAQGGRLHHRYGRAA